MWPTVKTTSHQPFFPRAREIYRPKGSGKEREEKRREDGGVVGKEDEGKENARFPHLKQPFREMLLYAIYKR
jgi:hypothetical protein